MNDTTQPPTPVSRHTPWLKHLLLAIFTVLGIWLLGWLAVPPLLKWQLETQAGQALGRSVHVDKVDFLPWTLEITVHGLQIASQDGSHSQLAVDRVYLDAELQSLWRMAPVLDALTVEHPQIRLRHLGRGHYDVDDVLAKLATPSASKAALSFGVFNIRIEGGELDFTDDTVGRTHTLRDLQLTVPFLSNLPSRRDVVTQPQLAFRLNGNLFDTRADTTPFAQSRHTDASLDIPDLDLTPYLPYWPAGWPVQPQAGHLRLQLKLQFEQLEQPQLKLQGEVALNGLRLMQVQPKGAATPFLEWKQLEVQVQNALPLQQQWHLGALRWTEPTLHLQRNAAGQTNLERIATALASPDAPRGQPSALALSLRSLVLENAQLHWKNEASHPATALHLRAPLLKAEDIAWTAEGKLTLPSLTLDAWSLQQGQDVVASMRQLQANRLTLDLPRQQATLDRLTLDSPESLLQRDRQGRWNMAAWFANASAAETATVVRTPAQAPSWQMEMTDLQLRNGALQYRDESTARPVRLQLTEVNLQAQRLQPLAASAAAFPVQLSMRMGRPRAARGEPGKLQYQGTFRLPAPPGTEGHALHTQGRLQLEHWPVHLLEPYFGDRFNLDLIRADTSYRGTLNASLAPDGLQMQMAGDVAVEDFRASTLSPAEDLLDWKTLSLRGLDLRLNQGQLQALSVKETVLSDYFARIVVQETGRINLQSLIHDKETETPAQTGAPPGAPANPAGSASAAPQIQFGPIALVNGKVYFSDRFVQPNYSANLSELTGSLGSFNNQPSGTTQSPELADLTLRGRAEGTATLEITGKLNPLAQPLAMDIKGAVRELELPPLSPYTAKYVGHGIERGKLSMDVAYKIEPDGRLNASNQLVLNQLSFGQRVEGSQAPNLPLQLAVALLADRNGVIDLDLPISGSLNDPQFRIGPIIVKLIFNLIGKAVTAPFALIAHAFGGGGEEMNRIDFAPGSARLDETARQRLDNVAKALLGRAALKLTVVGQSDLEAERSDYQRARLNEQLLMEKRRRQARQGATPDAETTIGTDEYAELLKAVYRRADIPKPRNLIGLAQNIAPTEMEKLLLAAIPVSASDLRELALARGVAVKDHLARLAVPTERLFLGAPTLSKTGEHWTPQAELSLSID